MRDVGPTAARLLLLVGWALGEMKPLAEVHSWQNCLANPSTCTALIFTRDVSGTLPTAIGKLTNLVEIKSSRTSLTGTLPSELGLLTKLERLDLASNRFVGPIPSQLGLATKLRSIVLNENQLTGALPTALVGLGALRDVALHENRLQGPLPAELGALSALEHIDLTGNSLTGTLPSSLGRLTSIISIELALNRFRGPLQPAVFQNWTRLKALGLRGNEFTGTIPSEMGLLTNLELLVIESNAFYGELPPELMKLRLMDAAACDPVHGSLDCYCYLQGHASDVTEWNNLRASHVPELLAHCDLAPLDDAALAARLARAPPAADVRAEIGLALGSSAVELDPAAQDALLTRLAGYLHCPRAWLALRALVDGSARLALELAPPSEAQLDAVNVTARLSGAALDELSAALGFEVLEPPSVVITRRSAAAHIVPHAACGMCMRHRCGGACGRAHKCWREPTTEPERTACMCACCAMQCGLGRFSPICRQPPSRAAAEGGARAAGGRAALLAAGALASALLAVGALAAFAARRWRRPLAPPPRALDAEAAAAPRRMPTRTTPMSMR